MISLNLETSWSVVKHLVEFFEEQEDGTYHIVKDPAKNNLQVFKSTAEEGEGNSEEDEE